MATLLGYGVLLALPATRRVAVALAQENRPFELLTFAFLMAAGVLGIRLARRLRAACEHPTVWGFFLAFSAALLVIGLEEVAWGQKFLNFRTPAALEGVNRQGELTLHNLGELQGRSEYFRLVFGAGGMIGVWLASVPRWSKIAVPRVLLSWFAIITLASLLDLQDDLFGTSGGFSERAWRWTSEVVEMLIGAAALLYVHFKARTLLARRGAAGASMPHAALSHDQGTPA